MEYLLPAIIGYVIGSIPFGLVLCALAGKGDIRKIGSGNIGATNVLRTGSKALAITTLILDIGKGAIAIFVTKILFQENCSAIDCTQPCPCITYSQAFLILLIAGACAILGHCYPVWLKFKGGKGVATTFGTLLFTVPVAALIACITWLIAAFLFKISSLAALIAAAIAPIATLYFYGTTPALIVALIAALVFWKHRENIQRLLKGEESKISFKKKKGEDDTA